MELGYSSVAYNRTLKGVMSESDRCSTGLFPISKLTPTSSSLFASIKFHFRRLEHVAKVIVEALKEKRAANNIGSSGMTRQEARDAAHLHISDTGLIDHVLKAMNNVIIGNYIVWRSVNRSTKVLEYTIQDFRDI
ncbi:RING/FYVE/PHD zinc finger superfamily protein [Perilla frutescens var. hirtella]|nr:RING/FYVE/PHD zinc finger superfamily protein [Perilla frutescens var. hirtella]